MAVVTTASSMRCEAVPELNTEYGGVLAQAALVSCGAISLLAVAAVEVYVKAITPPERLIAARVPINLASISPSVLGTIATRFKWRVE